MLTVLTALASDRIMLKQKACQADDEEVGDQYLCVYKDHNTGAHTHIHLICQFENLQRTIINGQNAQIQYMRDYLAGANKPTPDQARCPLKEAATGATGFQASQDPRVPRTTPGDLSRNVRCEILPSGAYTEIKVQLNYYAGEFGYFTIEGCAGANPNLVLAADHEYRFVQQHITNWYHPIGFAYDLDGAILDNPELEPGVDPSNSGCADTLGCQHPRYFKGDQFLGGPEGDFGLDVYEPDFALSVGEWREQNAKWNVRLKITDPTSPEIFYFCHIHGGMSGKINVCNYDALTSKCEARTTQGVDKKSGYIVDTPVALYSHSVPSTYDQRCGSTGLAEYAPGRDYDRHCKVMRQ